MEAPSCPNCGQPIHRAIDVPYGWWEWDAEVGKYKLCTASDEVEVAPWVHTSCMGNLKQFHPQNPVVGAGR